ncbi:MAG: general secretion pathway protein GspB, partial [Acidovorax sp.]|nr:general secretion pathway protein GspB [Acidovorax sp.]
PSPSPSPLLPPAPVALEPRPVAPKRVAEPVREKPAAAPAPAQARVREAPVTPPAAAPAAAPPGAAPPNGPVFAQSDLPPSVREQLPALAVTGATYSSNPAHRMAIVNGQVLQEGDQAAPGLKLERIEQSRTVWSFHGYRYAVRLQ